MWDHEPCNKPVDNSVCSVQSTQLCLTLCDPLDNSTPGFSVHHQLLELAQTHVHRVSDAIQISYPVLSPSPLAFNLSFPKGIGVFSSESVLRIRWPKYWHFTFSIWSSNEYSGLISLGLTGLISLQFKGLSRVFSNTTVQKHQFFGVQLYLWSNSHIHTWLLEKTIALTSWTFVGKVMSAFNMLSRLVIASLPRSRHLLTAAALTICSNLGAQENKVYHCFHCFPIYLPWSDGTRCHDLSFLNVEF